MRKPTSPHCAACGASIELPAAPRSFGLQSHAWQRRSRRRRCVCSIWRAAAATMHWPSPSSRRRGLAVEVHGCDISPVAIAEAQRAAGSLGFDPNGFFSRDVIDQPLPAGYHVIMCSLFLHHLDRQQAIRLIRRMADAAERIALVSDLRRTRLGLAAAWIGSRLFTRSPIVHVDAVRSVAGAFVESEVRSMVAESGLTERREPPSVHFRITRHWPQRWLLELEKH